MSNVDTALFNSSYDVFSQALNQRLMKHNVHSANVVNAQTPGYRAIGYEFEKQLQEFSSGFERTPLKITNSKHFTGNGLTPSGDLRPEVFVQPEESIGNDGNSVNIEREMGEMANNQLLYRATADVLNKKIGLLKYAIMQGR